MIRAMLVSDLHFGGEDRAALDSAAAFCVDFQPDAVLVAGDVSLTGRRREMEAAAEWLRSLDRPVAATPGNHDSPYWQPFARVLSPFGRFDRILKFSSPTSERMAVRTLNTARGVQLRRLDWSLGVVSSAQVDDIARDLSTLDPSILRVVLAHHPLVGPPEADPRARTRGGAQAAALLAQAGLDLVLTGHLHVPFIQELAPGARSYAIGGGTLSQRVRGEPPAFVTLAGGEEGGAVRAAIWGCDVHPPRKLREQTLLLRPERLRAADANIREERDLPTIQ